MSLVKLKNSLARQLQHRTSVAERFNSDTNLPAGTTFDVALKNRRLSVHFECPGLDVAGPGTITLSDHGYMLRVSMFGSAKDHTPEAEAVKARVEAICADHLAHEGATGKVYVSYKSSWYAAQARRMRQGAQVAEPMQETAAA